MPCRLKDHSMKSIKTLLLAAALLTASATPGLAVAHTDKPHDQ